MKTIKLFLICSLLVGNNKIITSIDSDNILIGKPIQLNIKAILDTLHFPRYPDLKNMDNTINIEKMQLSKNEVTYTIKIWDSGEIIFPSIPVEIIFNNQVIEIIKTKELILSVETIINQNTEDIKNIKSFREINLSNYFIKYFLILIILLSGFTILYLYKNNKVNFDINSNVITSVENEYQKAVKALNNITYPNPITTETIEKYYLKLSFILRKYIGSVYYFKATEMTTDEITYFIKKENNINTKLKIKIKNILIKSDSSKYAQYVPDIEDLNNDLNSCKNIIKSIHLIPNN